MATTTQRGLGWAHQRARAAALRALEPGEPCPLCRHPMYPWQRLDLDHEVARALGGDGPLRLTHSRCNRRRGALLGVALRQGRARRQGAPAVRNSQAW